MSDTASAGTALKGSIGRFQMFAFGFGSIIGSAWCVLVGSWLASAGPGGAVLGFLAGGIVVCCIGACYAELTSRVPVTGTEFSYVLHIFGRPLAFFVGWFVALAWICVTIFEGLAIAWLFERFAPGVPDAALYTVFGNIVTRNQLIIGLSGAPLIALLNYHGGSLLARFQSTLTYGFIAMALGFVVLMLFQGQPSNLEPLFPAAAPVWWHGALGIFAQCAFLLCGFQAVSQLVEERAHHISLRLVFRILVLAIGAATVFYCLVVVSTATATPWAALPAGSLAFVDAVRGLRWGHVLAPLVLLTAMFSLVKTWNGVFMMAARTLIALTRNGFLPSLFARAPGRSGVPLPIVLVILIPNLTGVFLGRGAIGMLVDTITISLVLGYAICCVGLVMLRRRESVAQPGVVTVGPAVLTVGVIGSIAMAGAALVMPPIQLGGFPLVYLVFPGWALIGALTYFGMRAKAGNQ
jgi:amino acid transporter